MINAHIVTHVAEADRRIEYLTLTTAGESAYVDLHGVAESYDARLATQFTADDIVKLRHMLCHLAGMA